MNQNLPSVINWKDELVGAAALLKSGLAPRDLKTPESILFVILAGRDMGLSPVQSLRSIRPIQGKIEVSADLQLGLAHRSGVKSSWVKLTDAEALLKLVAPWSIEPHISRFTIEDAKRAELLSNPTWRKYPRQMLRSRAITAGLKDIGFLIGAGVYAPGELGGPVTVDMTTGEVLPSEDEQKQPLEITSTAGTVEALDDQEREHLEEVARGISGKINVGVARGISGKINVGVQEATEQALRDWHELNTDQKVAVWAMLDKSVRKTLKAADAATKEKPAEEGPPSITLAKLFDTMRKRQDLDMLDADATLIEQLPADQQVECAAEYHRLRTELLKRLGLVGSQA